MPAAAPGYGESLPPVGDTPDVVAERWGDDSEAPTPSVVLAPDAPAETPDPDGEMLLILGGEERPTPEILANVAVVKFHQAGKLFDMDAGDGSYHVGDPVIVEGERGVQQGVVAVTSVRTMVTGQLRRILRRADDRDLAAAERNAERADELLLLARERLRERHLPLKLFRIELAPGGSRAVFYFSSDERIDFRDMVRDLAQRFHLRVELRQTGVRDEAKLVGGLASCGRELCCTTFLPRFEPVSIKMAKDQGLVLNPSKVSGQCGRLKCCLVYEEAAYRELRKGLPKMGKRVSTPAGEGRVVEIDVLRQLIRVSFEPGEFQTFPANVVSPLAPPAAPISASVKQFLPAVPTDDEEPSDGDI